MSGFTAGPWRFVGREAYERYICPEASSDPICMVIRSTKRPPEETVATHNLILDSPVFHETLSTLVDALEGRGSISTDTALSLAKALLDKHKHTETPPPANKPTLTLVTSQ